MARGKPDPELTLHIAKCGICRSFFEAQIRLTAAAASLAAENAAIAVPADLETAVRAEFERAHPRIGRPWWAAGAAAAAAAAVLIGAWLAERPAPAPAVAQHHIVPPAEDLASTARPPEKVAAARPPEPIRRMPRPRPAKAPAAENAAETEQPFIAIPFTAPLAPYERADVLRVDLPVSALIAAGLPVEVSDPAAHARADLIVSEDGRARAVRLISISDRSLP